jgi:hypothetical protein
MIQDSLMPYAKGKADIRACEERVRQIEQELAASGRVASLPPLHAAEVAPREITAGSEPTTYATSAVATSWRAFSICGCTTTVI